MKKGIFMLSVISLLSMLFICFMSGRTSGIKSVDISKVARSYYHRGWFDGATQLDGDSAFLHYVYVCDSINLEEEIISWKLE